MRGPTVAHAAPRMRGPTVAHAAQRAGHAAPRAGRDVVELHPRTARFVMLLNERDVFKARVEETTVASLNECRLSLGCEFVALLETGSPIPIDVSRDHSCGSILGHDMSWR
jgi:predicted nuclease with RNAse H fold